MSGTIVEDNHTIGAREWVHIGQYVVDNEIVELCAIYRSLNDSDSHIAVNGESRQHTVSNAPVQADTVKGELSTE
jgi:hypothetical protein